MVDIHASAKPGPTTFNPDRFKKLSATRPVASHLGTPPTPLPRSTQPQSQRNPKANASTDNPDCSFSDDDYEPPTNPGAALSSFKFQPGPRFHQEPPPSPSPAPQPKAWLLPEEGGNYAGSKYRVFRQPLNRCIKNTSTLGNSGTSAEKPYVVADTASGDTAVHSNEDDTGHGSAGQDVCNVLSSEVHNRRAVERPMPSQGGTLHQLNFSVRTDVGHSPSTGPSPTGTADKPSATLESCPPPAPYAHTLPPNRRHAAYDIERQDTQEHPESEVADTDWESQQTHRDSSDHDTYEGNVSSSLKILRTDRNRFEDASRQPSTRTGQQAPAFGEFGEAFTNIYAKMTEQYQKTQHLLIQKTTEIKSLQNALAIREAHMADLNVRQNILNEGYESQQRQETYLRERIQGLETALAWSQATIQTLAKFLQTTEQSTSLNFTETEALLQYRDQGVNKAQEVADEAKKQADEFKCLREKAEEEKIAITEQREKAIEERNELDKQLSQLKSDLEIVTLEKEEISKKAKSNEQEILNKLEILTKEKENIKHQLDDSRATYIVLEQSLKQTLTDEESKRKREHAEASQRFTVLELSYSSATHDIAVLKGERDSERERSTQLCSLLENERKLRVEETDRYQTEAQRMCAEKECLLNAKVEALEQIRKIQRDLEDARAAIPDPLVLEQQRNALKEAQQESAASKCREIATLERVTEAEKKISQGNDKIRELKESIGQSDQEIRNHKSTIEDLQRQLVHAADETQKSVIIAADKARRDAAKTFEDVCRRERAESDNVLQKERRRAQGMEKKIADLEVALDAINSEKEKLQSVCERSHVDSNELQTAANEMKNLEAKISDKDIALKKEIEHVRSLLIDREKMFELQNTVDNLKQNIGQEAEVNKSLQVVITTVKEACRSQMDTMSEQREILQTTLAKYEQENTVLRSENKKLMDVVASHQVKQLEMESSISENENRIRRLSLEKSSLESEALRLRIEADRAEQQKRSDLSQSATLTPRTGKKEQVHQRSPDRESLPVAKKISTNADKEALVVRGQSPRKSLSSIAAFEMNEDDLDAFSVVADDDIQYAPDVAELVKEAYTGVEISAVTGHESVRMQEINRVTTTQTTLHSEVSSPGPRGTTKGKRAHKERLDNRTPVSYPHHSSRVNAENQQQNDETYNQPNRWTESETIQNARTSTHQTVHRTPPAASPSSSLMPPPANPPKLKSKPKSRAKPKGHVSRATSALQFRPSSEVKSTTSEQYSQNQPSNRDVVLSENPRSSSTRRIILKDVDSGGPTRNTRSRSQKRTIDLDFSD